MFEIGKIPDEVGFLVVDINSTSHVIRVDEPRWALLLIFTLSKLSVVSATYGLRRVALSHGGTRDGQRPPLGRCRDGSH